MEYDRKRDVLYILHISQHYQLGYSFCPEQYKSFAPHLVIKFMNVDIIEPFNRIHLPGSSKITSLLIDDGTLFLGLSNGDLTIMKTNAEPEITKNSPRSVKSFRSFSDIKKLFNDNEQSRLFRIEKTFKNVTANQTPIVALKSLPLFKDNRKVILVGSSEMLQVYEWVGSHLNLLIKFEESKYYTTFGFMEVKDQKLLFVGVKKKLIVFTIFQKSRNVVDYVNSREILLKERLKTLACYPHQEKVLCALTNLLLFMDVNGNTIEEISTADSNIFNFSQGSSFNYFGLNNTTPYIKIVPVDEDNSIVVRGSQFGSIEHKNGTGLVCDTNVKLSTGLIDFAYLHPCYALLIYNKRFEIVNIKDGTKIQDFYHQLSSAQICLDSEGDSVFIGSGSNIFQFNILPYQKQLDQFLSIKGTNSKSKLNKDMSKDLKLQGLEEALSLISNVNEKDDFFKDQSDTHILNKKMKQLFLRDLYKEKAFIYFEEYSLYHEALVDIASEWVLSCRDILSLFPDFLNGEYRIAKEVTKSRRSKSIVRKVSINEADNTKFNYLGVSDSLTESEAVGSFERPNVALIDPRSKEDRKQQKILYFRKAVNYLIVYLTDQRRIHSNFMASSQKVPFINWKSVSLSVFDIYPDISPDNVEARLLHMASVIDTSLFLCYYYTKPMLLGPLLRLPNNKCDAETVNECLLKSLHAHTSELQNFMKELLDFYFGRGLHGDALNMMKKLAHESSEHNGDSFDEFLKGPDMTIAYMQRLGNEHLDLVLKNAFWILSENKGDLAQNARAIFMNDSYECESYDNFKVYDFLKNTMKRDDLTILYLEWLLNESDILDSITKKSLVVKLSTKLCLLYLKSLKSLKVSDEEFSKNECFLSLHRILSTTNNYEPWTVLKNIPTSEDRFLGFTIFIYKRLGEHQKSVDVLFNQLSDLDGAMKYCADVYGQPHNKEVGQNLLHKLLEDLLMHYGENQSRVVKLLELQGDKMDILRILTALPNSFPLHKVRLFFHETLRKQDELLNASRITSQLYKVGSIKVRNKWLETQSASVTINSGKQLCNICHTNLGYSVLCIDTDGQVVHYGCLNKRKTDK